MSDHVSGHISGCGCDPCVAWYRVSKPDPVFIRQFENRLDKNESWDEWKDRQFSITRPAKQDDVDHPPYYGGDSPYEVIKVAEAWTDLFHLDFNILSVIKYITRAGLKPDTVRLHDLRKAKWYLEREIAKYDS